MTAADLDQKARAYLDSLPTLTGFYRPHGAPSAGVIFTGTRPDTSPLFLYIDPLAFFRVGHFLTDRHEQPAAVTIYQGPRDRPTGLFTFALNTDTPEGAALLDTLTDLLKAKGDA